MIKILKVSLLMFVLLFSVGFVSAEGNFTELQDEINAATSTNNTLTLANDYIFNGGENPVEINSTGFVLDGNNSIIDGNGSSMIFNVTASNVTIMNVIIKNAIDGGIVATGDNLTIINGYFFNNTGAINSIGSLYIYDSTFVSNSALVGGAVYSEAFLEIAYSNFENNIAVIAGGAVYALGDLLVYDSIFDNNTATLAGGAIAAASNFNITGSTFKRNNATMGLSIAADSNNTNNYVEYNVIVDENPIVIASDLGSNTTLNLNWWGDNNDPNSKIVTLDNATYVLDNWYIMNLTANDVPIFAKDFGFNYTFELNNVSVDNNPLNLPEFDLDLSINGEDFDGNPFDARESTAFNIEVTSLNNEIIAESNGINVTNLTFNAFYETNVHIVIDRVWDINDEIAGSILLTFLNGTDAEGEPIYSPLSGQLINFTIDGIDFSNITDSEGYVNFDVNVTTLGEHSIIANFTGNSTFLPSSDNVTFLVRTSSQINVSVDDIIVGENATINIILTGANNTNITGIVEVSVNNETYEVNVTDGIGSLVISGLPAGNYNVLVVFNGNADYSESYNDTVYFNVILKDAVLNASDIEMFFRNGTQYIVTLTDADGNPIADTNVTINVNGMNYTRTTDANGTATLNINLIPGEYVITTYFDGGDNFNPIEIATNLTVKTVMVTNNLTKYYRNASQFVVSVLDGQGNPLDGENVSFNINGVFYTRLVQNGTATLNINLFPGEYIVTSTYNGLSYANDIKVLPTLITEDLTKNFGGPETFNATVLNGQGMPVEDGMKVEFNIHGILYTEYTVNGFAKLNINLNPGSYIATATYDGYSTSSNVTVLA